MSIYNKLLEDMPKSDMGQAIVDTMDTFYMVEQWFEEKTHKTPTVTNIVDLTKMILEREQQLKNEMVIE